MGGDADQIAAIVDALDADARRQNAAGIDLVDLRLHALDGGYALGAAPHQDDALHDVIDAVIAGYSEPRQIADGHLRHIADEYRRAGVGRDHGMADVLGGVDQPNAAHHGRLRTEVHGLAADIDIGVCQGLQHLRQ